MPNTTRKIHSEWEYIGDVWVDTGSILIGDPCNLTADNNPISDEDAFIELLDQEKWPDSINFANGTILVQAGFGDGIYPVEIKRTHHGDVAEARIVFIDEKTGLPR